MDPKISIRTAENHEITSLMAPPTKPWIPTDQSVNQEADRIADAIIAHRKTKPFASNSQLAEVRDEKGNVIFGNKDLISDGKKVHRTDSATEECFARLYDASTVRSRNFRIWVVGQALAPSGGENMKPEVLAETRRVFTVFADPGKRGDDGKIDPEKSRLIILHENEF
jgi:hypothetical protein